MSEQAQQQLQQLQQQVITLKARLFDVQEDATAQIKGFNEVFVKLAELLGLSKEEASQADSYINATHALVESAKVSKPVEGELAN